MTAVDDMFEAVRLVSEGRCLRTFALVDGALLLDLPPSGQRRWKSLDTQSLLIGSSEEVAAVGPLLFSIDEHFNKDFLLTLCDHSAGRVVGSLIASNRDLTELGHSLAQFAEVQVADGTEVLMRFFDPRVLPFWFQLLESDHRQQIADAVAHWHFWRHDFVVETKTFDVEAKKQLPRMLPMRLTLDAENALMNSCLPFTLIERLRTEDPAGLNRVPIQDRYTFFREQIDRAQSYGIHKQGDLEAYCCAAVEFGASFDREPRVHAAFLNARHGRTLDEVLTAITNNDWQRARDAH